MDQPTKGEHRNRGSLTTASLTLVPLDLKNSDAVTPVAEDGGAFGPGEEADEVSRECGNCADIRRDSREDELVQSFSVQNS